MFDLKVSRDLMNDQKYADIKIYNLSLYEIKSNSVLCNMAVIMFYITKLFFRRIQVLYRMYKILKRYVFP